MENFFAFLWDTGVDLWEEGKYVKFVLFILGLFAAFGAFILLFWMIVNLTLAHFETLLFLCGAPVGVIAAIRYALRRREPEPPPVQAPEAIELTRARADSTYPLMAQSVFLLLTELCRYLPGLIRPFSLGAVEAPTHYSITASFVTIFHFTISKGQDDTPVSTVQEILTNLIDQHLRAQDLPLAVPATYTNQAGETYPGLVCDGIYDCGQFLKIDIAVTNEAETTRLKARSIANLDRYAVAASDVRDQDFD